MAQDSVAGPRRMKELEELEKALEKTVGIALKALDGAKQIKAKLVELGFDDEEAGRKALDMLEFFDLPRGDGTH